MNTACFAALRAAVATRFHIFFSSTNGRGVEQASLSLILVFFYSIFVFNFVYKRTHSTRAAVRIRYCIIIKCNFERWCTVEWLGRATV